MIEGLEDIDEVRKYACLSVGEATATEFYAFTKLVKEWDVDKVLSNPSVVKDIKEGVFPNDFKGSSLELVLAAITEQKQVFEDILISLTFK